MKRASAFGSEKVVSSPPFCMFTVIGKDTVPDFSEVLSYPLTLKDCVTVDDHNEPVINIVIAITKGTVRNINYIFPSVRVFSIIDNQIMQPLVVILLHKL